MTRDEDIDSPVWLSDHEDLHQLLSTFLTKLEKGSRLLVRLTSKTIPSLFNYNSSDSSTVWHLIKMLETDFGVLAIELEKVKPDQEIYENAKIRFNPDKEDLVRAWLNRPKEIPYKEYWKQAVTSDKWGDLTNIEFLKSNPLVYLDKSASDIVNRLRDLERSLETPRTIRSLSAGHFWGDSKLFDNKQEYLDSAFPSLRENIIPRPLLVNAYIPESFSSVLFIENQDTFLDTAMNLMAITDNSTAVVYTAGYRATASRVRDKDGYTLSLLSQTLPDTLSRFKQWWEKTSVQEKPSYFWGDLDYSGLGILSSLRSTFPELKAWQPAYQVMLEHLAKGNSHPASSVNKGSQIDPKNTGCTYADNILLPAIRNKGEFVDQEAIEFSHIRNILQANIT